MTGSGDNRWDRADRLFEAALDLPEAERGAFLEKECAGDAELRALVDRLLCGVDTDDSFLQPGAVELGETMVGPETDEDERDLSGKTVDRYRLVREIGRGGMAVVYLAERADGEFEQQLALKLIKRGIDTDEVVRRFERERRILARIRHPNIARFIDGGTTDEGRPFFAMELVEGLPIDRYCNEKKLSVRERLALFLEVARAVGHAHRNLVVHRDIKPSNILVGERGEVKLLDFGIARLLQTDDTDVELTRTRDRLLTPAFSSPEQIQGKPVTTASDVYQLGVLLYLLLTDHSPHGETGSMNELARVIVEDAPTIPSAIVRTGKQTAPGVVSRSRGTSVVGLRRELAGDLDNIALLALRKEPERRYASVALLIEDIERYLEGRPVSARPDTLTYRTSKFVQRHKIAVGFAATLLVLLTGFAITMAVQAGRIARERDRANREAETAEQVSEFLVDMFKVADPGRNKGETITAREILETGAQQVSGELKDQPAVRARLMDTIGRVYQNLGLYDDAQPLIEESLELRRADPDLPPTELAESIIHAAWLLENRGEYDAAEPLYREALEITRVEHGDEHPRVASAINDLALLLYRKSEYDESEKLHRQALEMRRRRLEPDDVRIADSLSNLSLVLDKRSDWEGSEKLNLEALEIRRKAHGELHRDVAISLDNLGRIKHAVEDYEASLAYFTDGLEIRRKLFGNEHPEVASGLNNLASLKFSTGDREGAEALFREVIEIDRKLLGPDHPDYAQSLGNLAFVLMLRDNPAEALPVFEESLEIVERVLEEKPLARRLHTRELRRVPVAAESQGRGRADAARRPSRSERDAGRRPPSHEEGRSTAGRAVRGPGPA